MNALEQALAESGCLVIDGAMGTQLFAVGLSSGDSPELWNVDHPDRVRGIHEAYIFSGSDIVLTNSFGGTSFRLKLHQLHERVHELNKAAAENARAAADASGRRVLVAGSMGPSGELLEPMGEMTPETCAAAFAEQAEGLVAGGADILWLETLSDLDEVTAALDGIRRVSDLPVVVTMSYDTAGRTMMGVTGVQAAETLVPLGIAAIGVNCGNNLTDSEAAVEQIRSVSETIPIVSKANAGIPQWAGDALSYSGTPHVMAAHAHRVREKGASIIGACCGSGPAHIGFMKQVLRGEAECPDAPLPDRIEPEADALANTRQRRRRRRS